MSAQCAENSLPLRQTCNRCRDLKVRCQRRQSANDVLTSCVRCSRAGAVCTYSPQQRSGRPRCASNNGRFSTPARNKQPAASFPTPPSTDSLHTYDILSTNMTSDLSFPNMWFDLEPNEDVDHLLQPGEELALSSTFAFGGDNALTEMEGADGSIPSNGSTCSDDFVGEGISPNSSSFKNKQDVELDNNARMIEELSGLNLRIYKATSISPMRVLRDEIIEMTSNLLQILAASVDAARKPNHPVCTRDSLSSRVDHRFCQDSVELSNNHRTGARFPDTGSILMIFACYQRFLDLFKQVCLKLHRKLGGYYRPDGIPLVSVANHRCDTDSSTAQVVMTLELISHLLGRLHRGLHQLIMALSVDTQPPYSPETTPICSFSNIVSGSAVQPKEYPTRSGSSGDLPDGSEPRATARANCFQGAKFVIENMAQTQSSLYAHIKLIRASIEESHGI